MASEKVEALFRALDGMDRLELAGFKKRIETEWDLAPQLYIQPGVSTDAPAVEEQTSFTVTLESVEGMSKIAVLKVVRAATGLSLRESKDLVDSAPTTVMEELSQEQADALIAQIAEAGGTASSS